MRINWALADVKAMKVKWEQTIPMNWIKGSIQNSNKVTECENRHLKKGKGPKMYYYYFLQKHSFNYGTVGMTKQITENSTY